MNLVHKIEHWGDAHHPKVLDIVRIVLGVFLLVKGITFMENTSYLRGIITDQDVIDVSPDMLMILVYYVSFAHMVGGILIAMGILTRLGCIIQIPILVGAVFLTGIFQEPINTMLWPSITALALLILFTILGSGPWSLDKVLSFKR
ncbi:DoxX family protein [Mucilaginibacter gossypii]|uniref:DoxX family protein n=1 Tax=Mucilaginibacter gossypii TaxID=551996 RepID=UPI000DCF0A5E|nr:MULTISPECIES: DoxX family protein [Mucilaginibacter]QTE39911.1 DoxX family protein [Mucilaginibacter gossypii]RAV54464.1 DoxX family protein [Mucilaginibacter rubeus]